jgi:histidinol-phosphate aminotransferase
VPRRPAAEGFRLDPAAVRAAAATADLVWVCSPNNPTGLAEPPGAIDDLLETIAADADRTGRPAPTVVVDEAYAEFAGVTNLELRTAYPRLVLIRTMSKAYAIAGLRVGFAIARPEVIALLAPYRPPGSVSVASVTVATRLLEDDGVVVASVARVDAERRRLTDGLTAAGWTVHPSDTNFLLVSFRSRERAAAVAEALLRRALVPRTFGSEHPLASYLRVTVRNAEQDDRLLAAARDLGP